MFDYVLFDTKEIEDHAIIQHFKRPNVKIGVWFLKQNDNLIDFIQENQLLAREILREISKIEKENFERIMVYLYNVSGVTPEKIEQIMKTITLGGQEIINKHLIKLFEQGIEQELKKIAVNMITKGYSDEQIAEITNLSIKRILVLRKECSV